MATGPNDVQQTELLRPVGVPTALENSFLDGDLPPQLLSAYPELFDEMDLALVQEQRQPKFLFKNWMAAIDLFQRRGYASLQDPYFKPNHTRKYSKMREILPAGVADLVSRPKVVKGREAPNLLAYRVDGTQTNWWFAHVARVRPGAKPSLEQEKLDFFAEITRLTNKPIRLIPVEVGFTSTPLKLTRLNPPADAAR